MSSKNESSSASSLAVDSSRSPAPPPRFFATAAAGAAAALPDGGSRGLALLCDVTCLPYSCVSVNKKINETLWLQISKRYTSSWGGGGHLKLELKNTLVGSNCNLVLCECVHARAQFISQAFHTTRLDKILTHTKSLIRWYRRCHPLTYEENTSSIPVPAATSCLSGYDA